MSDIIALSQDLGWSSNLFLKKATMLLILLFQFFFLEKLKPRKIQALECYIIKIRKESESKTLTLGGVQ